MLPDITRTGATIHGRPVLAMIHSTIPGHTATGHRRRILPVPIGRVLMVMGTDMATVQRTTQVISERENLSSETLADGGFPAQEIWLQGVQPL